MGCPVEANSEHVGRRSCRRSTCRPCRARHSHLTPSGSGFGFCSPCNANTQIAFRSSMKDIVYTWSNGTISETYRDQNYARQRQLSAVLCSVKDKDSR